MASNLTPAELASLTHHHVYGYPGHVQETRVKADEWRTKPFANPRREQLPAPGIPITSTDDVTRLLNGSLPRQMEDKWFVYADEPDEQGKSTVYCFRSWTGYKVGQFDIQLVKAADLEGQIDSGSETESEGGSVSAQSMDTRESARERTEDKARPVAYVTAFEWEEDNEGAGMKRNGAMERLHQVSCWVLGTSSWELPDAYKGPDGPEASEAAAATEGAN